MGQNLIIPTFLNQDSEYIVKKGDTLYSIAQKYNTSVDNLKSINNQITDSLSIGQILKIPKVKDNEIYTVLKNDTLYSIAKKFNTTINEIISINNLESTILSIGQKLLIP